MQDGADPIGPGGGTEQGHHRSRRSLFALMTLGETCSGAGRDGRWQHSTVPWAMNKDGSPGPAATCSQGSLLGVREICRRQVRFQVRASFSLTTCCTRGPHALNILPSPELY